MPATTTADAMGIAIARSIHEEKAIVGGDINILRTGDKYMADYISFCINGYLKPVLAKYAKGANILHLSNSDVKNLEIVIPPIETQKQFVAEFAEQEKWIQASKETIAYMERAISKVLSEI